jgi:hypothetical protein
VTAPLLSPTCPAEAVAFYTALHVSITPVRAGAKQGRLKGWSVPGLQVKPADFKPGDNVGVLNGTLVGDGWFFHDADIDVTSEKERALIECLLPPTGWWYGRPGKPRSHGNYLVKGQLRTCKHEGVDGKVILEVRGITQKKTYTLSVAPGSTHTSGEAIRFVEPVGPIGRIEVPETLDTSARGAAVAVVIFRVWPAQNRHKLRLAFAKLLLEQGLTQDHTTAILEAVMEATHSDEHDVKDAVASTAAEMREGRATAGASVVLEVLGKDDGQPVLTAIAHILRAAAVDDGTTINVNEPTTVMLDRAWDHVIAANEPPGLFARGKDVLILHDCANTCLDVLYDKHGKSEDLPKLQHVSGFRVVSVDTFREIVGRMVPCVEVTRNKSLNNVCPGREFASLMLARPVLPLLEPSGFTPIPFFTPGGLLVTTPGLHRETGMFYQPAPGFVLPDIPEHPTARDVGMAITMLDDMVWQFPFKGREGRHPFYDVREGCDWRQTTAYANMLAFPLTVLARSLFHAVPLFLVDKSTPRTGASHLVQCWCYVLTGAWPSEAEWDGSEAERRKFLTAILITGTPIVFLDEVKDLKSPDLNKILTGKNARIGRVLGSTEITNPHNYATFVATGNNPAFPKDMAGRMCRVRLDADMEHPGERGQWEKDLTAWVPEHRLELLRALYVLARAWFAAGRPVPEVDRVLNGFEPWSVTIGGVLANAGLTGFLANKREVEDDAAEEEDDMDAIDALLVQWVEIYNSEQVTVPELCKRFEAELPVVNGQKWTTGNLGAWLQHNRDRQQTLSNGEQVRFTYTKTTRLWRLKLLSRLEPETEETASLVDVEPETEM